MIWHTVQYELGLHINVYMYSLTSSHPISTQDVVIVFPHSTHDKLRPRDLAVLAPPRSTESKLPQLNWYQSCFFSFTF